MRPRTLFSIRTGVLVAALLPLARLVYRGVQTYRGEGEGLGANPIEAITHTTGDWALYLLLATLLITPLRRLSGQGWLLRLRRRLGLLAFTYVCVHFSTYLLDQGLDAHAIAKDVLKRPYVTAGTLGFLLLVPLAVTSTRSMIRRLGRRWQTLHRLVYASALLGVTHYAWLVKADLRKPLVCGAVLFVLMAARLYIWSRPVAGARRAAVSNPASD